MGSSSSPVTEVAPGQQSPPQDDEACCSRSGRECRLWRCSSPKCIHWSHWSHWSTSWCCIHSRSSPCWCIQCRSGRRSSSSANYYPHWLPVAAGAEVRPDVPITYAAAPAPAIVAPQPYSVHTGTKVEVAAEPVEQHGYVIKY